MVEQLNSLLIQLRCNQNDMLDYTSSAVKVITCKFPQTWRQIFEKLRRVKFLRIEISYDCVLIEGYRTRTKKSYGKLSFDY